MRLSLRVMLVSFLLGALVVAPGCSKKMVTVETGEIVLCTEGEIISNTVEEIEVPADEVGDHGVTTRVETCDLHLKLQALYDDAQDLIRAGDLEGAKKKLAEIEGLSPGYRNVAAQLEGIEDGTIVADSGGSSTGGGTGGTTDGDTDGAADGDADGNADDDPGGNEPPGDTPGDDNPTGPIMNLIAYVPDTLPGFVGQSLITDPFVLTRNYLPTSSGDIDALVIVVEQFKDASAAQAAIDESIAPSYPTAGSTVTVAGAKAYFGANQSVGIVAFTNGAVMIAVEGATMDGKGSDLKDSLLEICEVIAQ